MRRPRFSPMARSNRVTQAATIEPYAPSLLNRLYAAIERLPFGGWWVYPLTFVALVAYHQAALWITGGRPVGSITLDGIYGLVYGPYTLAALHVIVRVAGTSIATFRPASGLSDADYERRRYELVTIPSGWLWICVAVGAVVGLATIVYAPAGATASYGDTVSQVLIVAGPAAAFGYGMFAAAAYETVRMLRQVDRLHREATALDLYDTGPLYAFSRLTVLFGIGYVFAGYYGLVANAAYQASVLAISIVGLSILMGVACFIVPLWGIHGRLSAEKATLMRGVNLRAQALQEELFHRVDGSTLAGVKDVTDALGGVYATRDQIVKLPTWPWPPQVLRGFISAILLPVVVFILTRLVGSQLV